MLLSLCGCYVLLCECLLILSSLYGCIMYVAGNLGVHIIYYLVSSYQYIVCKFVCIYFFYFAPVLPRYNILSYNF